MRLAPQEIRTFFITSVTWERRPIFRSDSLARLFLDTLARYRSQGRFLLHEFVLMPNHFHLLITPAPEVPMEKAVQFIKGGFSFRVKREMNSNLVIWQTEFTDHRIRDAEDYERHVTYIRENPVRAHLAETPEAYAYCSASGALEIDPPPPGLKPRSKAASNSPRKARCFHRWDWRPDHRDYSRTGFARNLESREDVQG
jgi:putative transposase